MIQFSNLTRGIARVAAAVALSATFLQGAALSQEMQDGKLQPLGDGFPNKPITVMVVDEPGSADSVFATQIVEAATAISPVELNIQHRVDFSNFGTWEALAWVQDQQELGNDGYIVMVYTLVGAVIDLLVIDMEKEVGVGLDDMAPIVALEQLPYILNQRADAPWGKTLDELVAYAKEHPGEVRHITGGAGGGQDAAMQVWIRNLGFTVKDIVGGSTGERALTVAAGEGDITVSPIDTFLPHYEAGRSIPLMSSGKNPVPPPFESVPNAESLGMTNDPFDQTRVLGVPATVPEEHRAWLTKLFIEASNNPDYQAKRKQTPGLSLVQLGPDEVMALSQGGYDAALPIMKEMGVFIGDK